MGSVVKAGAGLYSRLVIGAVLLAAGSGSRLGGRPKSLLELGGVSLIRRQLIALSGAGVDEVVVVLGHYAEQIELAVQAFPVTIIRNPHPDDGQVSSLRLGLQALSSKIDAVVVVLADQPLINAQDINDLIGAFKKRAESTEVVVPTVGDLPGNPVVFTAQVKDAVLAGDAHFGCKQWQMSHPDKVYRWDSSNQRYRVDVDSPEDIEALAEQTGHILKWPADWTQA
jgi:molybdenum cofactor cytidylyltransferase